MAEKILTVFINESDDFEPYVIVEAAGLVL